MIVIEDHLNISEAKKKKMLNFAGEHKIGLWNNGEMLCSHCCDVAQAYQNDATVNACRNQSLRLSNKMLVCD